MSPTAKELERVARNVNPGGWAVERDHPIATLLGSCVAVCLYDPQLRLGGLNHFMLPSMGRGKDEVDVLLGGDFNMEALMNGMLGRGARKERMVAKAFGGGAVVGGLVGVSVGERNASFAREWLEREGIPLLAADLLGPWSRKIVFDPASGDAYCRRIANTMATAAEVARKEAAYQQQLVRQSARKGDIELF